MSDARETLRTRPGVVTAATALLYAGAALQVLGLVAQLAQFPALRGFLDDEISPHTEPDGGIIFRGILAIVGVLAVALAITLARAGAFVANGRQKGRTMAWLVAGLVLLCAAGERGGAAQWAYDSSTSSGMTYVEIRHRIDALIPDWAAPVTGTLAVVNVLVTLGYVILLTTPSANGYLRRSGD